MAHNLKIDRGDMWFQAVFVQPAFELFKDYPVLYRSVLEKLGPHGVTIDDMKMVTGDGNLGEAELQAFLYGFTASARIRLSRVEVRTPLRSGPPEALVIDTLDAITAAVPEARFATYDWTLGVHAFIDGLEAKDFVATFCKGAPSTLGNLAGSSVSFYYGPDAARKFSALTIDLSGAVERALFLRFHVIWNADGVSTRTLPELAKEYVGRALEGIGLQLEG